MTAPNYTRFRAPFFIDKQAAMREFDDSRFLTDPVVQTLKPECPFEHGYGYFVRLISNGMENIVEDMLFSRLPEYAWSLMQNFGVSNEEYHQSLHLILHDETLPKRFDRTNWRVTPRTLELLNLAYRRGQAIESCAAIRREAIRAYLDYGLPAMADVLKPVPGLLVKAVEATTLN
jgi:hypothetical protein